MMYSFDVEVAKKHGVEAAVLIHNIGFWLKKNIANRSNIYDGFVWTFNTSESFEELFPFWSGSKIARMLRDLENEGVLKSGNYNKVKFDRTKWYTIADISIIQIYELHCANLNNGLLKNEQSDYSEMNNGLFINEQPIPDSKHADSKKDSKHSLSPEKSGKTEYSESFEKFWEYYGRKGNKISAYKQWCKLSDIDLQEIRSVAKLYIKSRPEIKYRLDAEKYLNPTTKRWNDTIVNDNSSAPAPILKEALFYGEHLK